MIHCEWWDFGMRRGKGTGKKLLTLIASEMVTAFKSSSSCDLGWSPVFQHPECLQKTGGLLEVGF